MGYNGLPPLGSKRPVPPSVAHPGNSRSYLRNETKKAPQSNSSGGAFLGGVILGAMLTDCDTSAQCEPEAEETQCHVEAECDE